nr:ISAzo13 family transposase [Bathymodiolus platifrons methanotrophic gill symbiont]
MIEAYPQKIETQMQELYNRLLEKHKRLYAGIEALKLAYGGVTYIAKLFNCSRNTIKHGLEELGAEEILPRIRNRKKGGGRKAILDKEPDINEVFLCLIKKHTAGNPMDETQKWTNLTRANMSDLLAREGFKVSRNVVRKLLKNNGYVKRKPLKNKAGGGHVDRNSQFERIAELKDIYTAEGNPILSVDTKKKEKIGNLSREGKIYTTETIEVYDHDFPSLAEGVAVPHTVYDQARNEAYVTVGTSRDTSEFACDSLRHWWYNYGILYYANATSF